MKEVLLLKCGEIVLKGLNRKTFEDRLLKNLSRRMKHVADCEISMRQSVVYGSASRPSRARRSARKRRSKASSTRRKATLRRVLRRQRPLRSRPSAVIKNSP